MNSDASRTEVAIWAGFLVPATTIISDSFASVRANIRATCRNNKAEFSAEESTDGTLANRIRVSALPFTTVAAAINLVAGVPIAVWPWTLAPTTCTYFSLASAVAHRSRLAGVQLIRVSDRMTVIYLLDQSDSIPVAKRQLMLQYAIENVKKFRRSNREDRAGLIVFGREASIEFPPLDDDLPPIRAPESYLGKTDATNLESALKLAQASFPEDSARRVVILTDGNETLGQASAVAKSLSDAGIGIDVVPIRLDSSAEVLVEKIDVPGNVRQGQSVDAKVVVHRYVEEGSDRPVEGTLRITQRVGNSSTVNEQSVVLDQDVNIFPWTHKIDVPAGYTYEAVFVPKEDATIRSLKTIDRQPLPTLVAKAAS